MIDYHKLPLKQSQDTAITFKKIREYVSKYPDTAYIEKDENLTVLIRGVGANSHFTFLVNEPKLNTSNNNQTQFNVEYSPRNGISTDNQKTNTVGDSVLKILSQWVSYLQQYNNLLIHPQDNINSQYEDEFEHWYEIVDEDADTNAFDSKRQILITNAIEKSVKLLLEQGVDKDDDLILEAEQLKSDITRLTKKQVFKRLKGIYAKLKIKGLDKLKLVYDVCEKEVIKMGFHMGAKGLAEKLQLLIESVNN